VSVSAAKETCLLCRCLATTTSFTPISAVMTQCYIKVKVIFFHPIHLQSVEIHSVYGVLGRRGRVKERSVAPLCNTATQNNVGYSELAAGTMKLASLQRFLLSGKSCSLIIRMLLCGCKAQFVRTFRWSYFIGLAKPLPTWCTSLL
jgi:hypothetical protein